jgi:hypothetical protein
MAITPIRQGEEPALQQYLRGLPQQKSPLGRLSGTHFARWVILDHWVNDPAQPQEDRLGCSYLIFTSNFDGALDAYLDELCDKLPPDTEQIWGRCLGCPSGAAGPALKAYLLHNQIHTGFFVAAYPDSRVPQVKAALAARERVIALALAAPGLTAEELKRRFEDEL